MSEPVDVLNIPDGDMADLDVEALVAQAEAAHAAGGEGTGTGGDGNVDDGEADGKGTVPDVMAEGGDPADEDAATDGDLEGVVSEEAQGAEGEGVGDEGNTEKEEAEGEEGDKPEGDEEVPEAQAQLDALFAPLKAIGKEVEVTSIEDARQLMQMGIGYNKRMAALKPHMNMLKMLEKNDILDPDKLNYLIDLQNKDPAAIAKLVKDSGIDPLDIPTKDLGEYKPKSYTVSDEELALGDVVDEIRESEHYATTSDIVTNKWDQASQDLLVNNPGNIRMLNEQVGNGQYDQITKVVESERMFNRLNGVSDFEAYQQVGMALAQAGTLVGLESPTNPKTVIKAPAEKAPSSGKTLKDRKRAAAPSKAKSSAPAVQLDPLAMSDEEFNAAEAKGLFKFK